MPASRFILITEGLDGQHGGVQRVSRSVLGAVKADPAVSWVWSSNDAPRVGAEPDAPQVMIRCFGRRYASMVWAALADRLPPAPCARIFCWHLRLLPVAVLLKWRLGCPLEVFLHGVEAWGALPPRLRWCLGKVDSFGANSAYTLRRFREAHPSFANRPGRVLPLGLGAEFLAGEAIHEAAQDPARPYFLAVMRFAESYKGEETLLRAFAEVRRAHPRLRLLCAGDGPLRPHWMRRAAELGLADAATFLGRVTDAELAGLYARCLGFVLLSEGEGFGIVYLEAMYHGKPCIATDADASSEIVRDGVTGLTVPPRDIAATARALRRLLEEPGLAARLGAAAKIEVAERFLPRHFHARLAAFMSLGAGETG